MAAPIGFVILAVLWLIWFAPFLIRRRGGGEKPTVKARSARWGILLQGVAFAIVSFHYPFWPLPELPKIVGMIVLGLLAAALSWSAVSALGKQWRIDAALSSDHALIQSGPYAVVRHPIYSSMLAMMLATGLMLSIWILLFIAVLVFLIGTEIRVRTEEKLLSARFGPEFENYRNRVPAYIPGLR